MKINNSDVSLTLSLGDRVFLNVGQITLELQFKEGDENGDHLVTLDKSDMLGHPGIHNVAQWRTRL